MRIKAPQTKGVLADLMSIMHEGRRMNGVANELAKSMTRKSETSANKFCILIFPLMAVLN